MFQPAFTFPGLTTRVVFGPGTRSATAEEVKRLGKSRALVLSTPGQADDAARLADEIGSISAGTFTEAAMHTPVDITDKAVEAYRDAKADCVVSIGGGSTIGLGKAIATRTGADQVVLPTTYAGSEMTDILGETRDGEKTTRRDPSIRPETVICDVELTLGLPLEMTMQSGLNAIAHAVEALYAPDRNPIMSLMAADALSAFKQALPALREKPDDGDARARALYGAWLCSAALGSVQMSLHHKLCHVLGGTLNTPHAATHAILLPHTAGFNGAAVPDLLKPVEETFGSTPGAGLWTFAKEIGAPMRLADLGVDEGDLDKAAEVATRNPYDNPRPIDREAIRVLLQAAFEGEKPGY